MVDFIIPDAALDAHTGILGRTGSGKTFTARGLVERLLDAQRQVVIVDPTGAWWGLRSAFAIPIFGGEHGDVEITDQSGEAVAETILAHHSSAIVDLSGLARRSGAAMRRFMAAFVARLKDRERGALWLVLDEADEFLPQVLSPDMTRLFGDLKWIVRRGRVAGWRVMMITQRPQDIAKSVLTQIGTLVAHRLTAPQDRKAVEEWVKGHADPEEAKQVLSSLAGLQRGEAWVWSPENELLVRAAMPPIRSFDSGATPDADSGAIAQPELASIDLSAIRATLEAGKSVSRKPTVAGSDNIRLSDADAAELATLRAQRDEWTIESAVGQQQLDELQNVIAGYQRAFQAQAGLIADIQWPSIERADETMPFEPQVVPPLVLAPVLSTSKPARQPAPPREGPLPMNAAARKMIEILDRIAPAKVPWGSLAAMIGNKARGGNFNAARKAMRESGLVIEDGDAVRSAQPPADGMTRQEAMELWHEVLSNPAPRMIDALHQLGPMSKPQIGESLNIAPRGGNFNNGIAQLIRNGVVIDRGGILHLADPLPGESK